MMRIFEVPYFGFLGWLDCVYCLHCNREIGCFHMKALNWIDMKALTEFPIIIKYFNQN